MKALIKHLSVFLTILLIVWLILRGLRHTFGVNFPPLAAWDLAAMIDVILVAWRLMDFAALPYTNPYSERRVRKVVILSLLALVVGKICTVVFESQIHVAGQGGVGTSISEFPEYLRRPAHVVSPFIIVAPLFLFAVTNAVYWVTTLRHLKTLGVRDRRTPTYLMRLLASVDLPVVVPYLVVLIYMLVDPITQSKEEFFAAAGLIGCTLLVVSNILTSVFDEFQGAQILRSTSRPEWE